MIRKHNSKCKELDCVNGIIQNQKFHLDRTSQRCIVVEFAKRCHRISVLCHIGAVDEAVCETLLSIYCVRSMQLARHCPAMHRTLSMVQRIG
jgi:hypothetical protein